MKVQFEFIGVQVNMTTVVIAPCFGSSLTFDPDHTYASLSLNTELYLQ